MADTRHITPAEIDALVTKIGKSESLSVEECGHLCVVVRSLAAMVAALDSQADDLTMTIEILQSEREATQTSRNAALNGLRKFAPAASTVDVETARTHAAEMRESIEKQNSIAQITVAAARFAVGVAGKFV